MGNAKSSPVPSPTRPTPVETAPFATQADFPPTGSAAGDMLVRGTACWAALPPHLVPLASALVASTAIEALRLSFLLVPPKVAPSPLAAAYVRFLAAWWAGFDEVLPAEMVQDVQDELPYDPEGPPETASVVLCNLLKALDGEPFSSSAPAVVAPPSPDGPYSLAKAGDEAWNDPPPGFPRLSPIIRDALGLQMKCSTRCGTCSATVSGFTTCESMTLMVDGATRLPDLLHAYCDPSPVQPGELPGMHEDGSMWTCPACDIVQDPPPAVRSVFRCGPNIVINLVRSPGSSIVLPWVDEPMDFGFVLSLGGPTAAAGPAAARYFLSAVVLGEAGGEEKVIVRNVLNDAMYGVSMGEIPQPSIHVDREWSSARSPVSAVQLIFTRPRPNRHSQPPLDRAPPTQLRASPPSRFGVVVQPRRVSLPGVHMNLDKTVPFVWPVGKEGPPSPTYPGSGSPTRSPSFRFQDTVTTETGAYLESGPVSNDFYREQVSVVDPKYLASMGVTSPPLVLSRENAYAAWQGDKVRSAAQRPQIARHSPYEPFYNTQSRVISAGQFKPEMQDEQEAFHMNGGSEYGGGGYDGSQGNDAASSSSEEETGFPWTKEATNAAKKQDVRRLAPLVNLKAQALFLSAQQAQQASTMR